MSDELDALRTKVAIYEESLRKLAESPFLDPLATEEFAQSTLVVAALKVQSLSDMLAQAEGEMSDWSKFMTRLVVDYLGYEPEEGNGIFFDKN